VRQGGVTFNLFSRGKKAQMCHFGYQRRVSRDTIIDYRGTLRICGPFKKYDTLRTVDAQKRKARETRGAEDFIS